MNCQTIAALNRINRSFYRRNSEDFSRTRRNSWPGWEQVLAAIQECRAPAGVKGLVSILDAGCGNGRFLQFLGNRVQGAIRYVGVDASLPLLVKARQSAVGPPPVNVALVAADLVTDRALECLRPESFDLAVAFGLLHHIPGRQARLSLLIDLASSLRPSGVMAVSFWQFGSQRRYVRRSMSWEEYNRQADESIDVRELEEGDRVLIWGELLPGESPRFGSAVRYCHFTDPTEADRLVSSLPLDLLERFASDGDGGRQNLYYLLRRPRD